MTLYRADTVLIPTGVITMELRCRYRNTLSRSSAAVHASAGRAPACHLVR